MLPPELVSFDWLTWSRQGLAAFGMGHDIFELCQEHLDGRVQVEVYMVSSPVPEEWGWYKRLTGKDRIEALGYVIVFESDADAVYFKLRWM